MQPLDSLTVALDERGLEEPATLAPLPPSIRFVFADKLLELLVEMLEAAAQSTREPPHSPSPRHDERGMLRPDAYEELAVVAGWGGSLVDDLVFRIRERPRERRPQGRRASARSGASGKDPPPEAEPPLEHLAAGGVA